MKEKILILEDEIGIRSFVSINLKREGYEVIEAGCGQEAIDKIKNEKNILVDGEYDRSNTMEDCQKPAYRICKGRQCMVR